MFGGSTINLDYLASSIIVKVYMNTRFFVKVVEDLRDYETNLQKLG